MISGGIFDVAQKQSSLEDIQSKLSDESTWSNLELSQSLNKEKADLEKFLDLFLSDDEATAPRTLDYRMRRGGRDGGRGCPYDRLLQRTPSLWRIDFDILYRASAARTRGAISFLWSARIGADDAYHAGP